MQIWYAIWLFVSLIVLSYIVKIIVAYEFSRIDIEANEFLEDLKKNTPESTVLEEHRDA